MVCRFGFCVVFDVLLTSHFSTQYAPTMLTPALLSRFKKRFYPQYKYVRREDIWPTREALVEYESALALEARVDGILENSGPSRARSVASKTPGPQFKTPNTPALVARGKGKDKENCSMDDDDDLKADSPRVQDARLVKEIFESIYLRWKGLVAAKGEDEGRPAGLERFDSGELYNLSQL